MIFWFTGLPGTGKTTLGLRLTDELSKKGRRVVFLDGDELRAVTQNNDYTREGRVRNVTVAQWFADRIQPEGLDAVVAIIAPFRAQREAFKADMRRKNVRLVELYTHCGENRKPGADTSAYEEPLTDFVGINTDLSVEQCVEQLRSLL